MPYVCFWRKPLATDYFFVFVHLPEPTISTAKYVYFQYGYFQVIELSISREGNRSATVCQTVIIF